jgi:L-xylulokinase
MPVIVTETDEAAAWGAALCAGAAVGLFASLRDDPRDLARLASTYAPDAARRAAYRERFRVFCRVADTLAPLWPEIDRLGEAGA